MAIRDPYDSADFEHPDFADGTRSIYMHDPIGATPGDHTFYLARRFQFSEGDYVIKLMADDAATAWIGETALTSRLVLSAAQGGDMNKMAAIANVHIPEGEYRFDVMVQNMHPVPNPAWFALNIEKDGQLLYTSAKEGWLLDDAPIADDDIPPLEDLRLSLPVWSVLPNWKPGITERLAWLTDVISSECDAEQRRSVRLHARRSLEAQFLRKGTARSRIDNFLTGVGANKFMIPLWHEQVVALEGVTIDSPAMFFEANDLLMREFRAGDLVFVNNKDPNEWEILKVASIESDRLTWAILPKKNWPVGTRVYPMREARLTSPPRMSNLSDEVGRVQIRFTLVEPYEVAESWGQEVGGEPYFRYRVNRAVPVETGYGRLYYETDNNVGVPHYADTGKYSVNTLQTKVTMFGRQAVYGFRQFLAAARGRARHFYCPSFTNDVKPVSDIVNGDQQMLVESMGYYLSYPRPQPNRLQMAIDFVDARDTIYSRIVTVSPVYKLDEDGQIVEPRVITAELFELAAPLPAIQLRDIHRISFVSETRFDQDEFEIFHANSSSRAVEATLMLRQMMNPRKESAT